MAPRLGAARWVAQVVGWVVLLVGVALVVVAVLLPRAGGGTPDAVLTGSMTPTLPVGTLAVTRPVHVDDVQVGDVITYQLVSGEPTVVTHRVVGSRRTPAGERELLTKGDANPTLDRDPVKGVQLRGRVWYAVPHLGRMTGLLSVDQRRLGVYGLGGGLALYALAMLASALRDHRSRPHGRAGRRAADVAA